MTKKVTKQKEGIMEKNKIMQECKINYLKDVYIAKIEEAQIFGNLDMLTENVVVLKEIIASEESLLKLDNLFILTVLTSDIEFDCDDEECEEYNDESEFKDEEEEIKIRKWNKKMVDILSYYMMSPAAIGTKESEEIATIFLSEMKNKLGKGSK